MQTLLVADYSSLEIGIQGDFAQRLFGDGQIIQMYRDQIPVEKGGPGIDLHSNNARAVFGKWLGWKVPEGKGWKYEGLTVDHIPVQEFKEHPFGKSIRDDLQKPMWYGMAYGKGDYGFQTLIGPDGRMIGIELAGKMVNALLDAVPAMRRWFTWCEEYVREHHGIYSLGGRWCDLRAEMESGDEWLFKRAFRRAFNFPCQATGADIMADALVRISRCPVLRRLGFRVCLQVHDEFVLRGPLAGVEEAKEYVKKHMVSATAGGIPLLFEAQVSVGHGPTYFDAK